MEGPLGSARLDRIPAVLVLKDDGTHEEVSTFRFSPPAPQLDKPGFPHWGFRAVEEPQGGFVVRQVVPVAQMPGVQPLNRTTVAYRPIARANARGEVYDDVALIATPAGQEYYVREALRGGLTFGPAAADLCRDFSVPVAANDLPGEQAVYHHGLYREIPLFVGPQYLGRAHVLDEDGAAVLLGVEPGPAAYVFRLWNVHLATVAAHALFAAASSTIQCSEVTPTLVDEARRMSGRYFEMLYAVSTLADSCCVRPNERGRVPWAAGLALLSEMLIEEGYCLDPFVEPPGLPSNPALVYLRARGVHSWGLRVAPTGDTLAMPESILPFSLPPLQSASDAFGLPAAPYR